MDTRDINALLLTILILNVILTTGAPLNNTIKNHPHKRHKQRTDWLSPCGYRSTKRSHRDVKSKENALFLQVNHALQYYKKELRHIVQSSKSQQLCDIKIKNGTSLQDYYIELLLLGYSLDSNINTPVKNAHIIDFDARLLKLEGVRNQTKLVLCEISDVFKKRHRRMKSIRKKVRDMKKRQNKMVATNASETIMKDPCLFKKFEKTLQKLKGFLAMPSSMRHALKKRKQQQKRPTPENVL